MKKILVSYFCVISLLANCQERGSDSLNRYDSDGKKTGKWIGHWTETGNTASVEYFIGGKRNGVCTYYNMNGYVVEVSEYLNDSLHGISKVYSSGSLMEIAEFKNGKREGFTKYYNYKSQLIEEMEYHGNVRDGVHRLYYTNGRVQMEGKFVNGRENGTRRTYKNNGKKEIVLETDFVNDVRIERRYYRKGKLVKVEKEPSL